MASRWRSAHGSSVANPDVIDNKWRKVIRVPEFVLQIVVNSGAYSSTGISMDKMPSSRKLKTAAAVKLLVIDAMRYLVDKSVTEPVAPLVSNRSPATSPHCRLSKVNSRATCTAISSMSGCVARSASRSNSAIGSSSQPMRCHARDVHLVDHRCFLHGMIVEARELRSSYR